MKKRILIEMELISSDKKIKRQAVRSDCVFAIPHNEGYSFYYVADGKIIEELVINAIEDIGVEMMLIEPKRGKAKLLLEKKSKGN